MTLGLTLTTKNVSEFSIANAEKQCDRLRFLLGDSAISALNIRIYYATAKDHTVQNGAKMGLKSEKQQCQTRRWSGGRRPARVCDATERQQRIAWGVNRRCGGGTGGRWGGARGGQ